MNKFLSKMLRYFNAVAAVLIIVGFTFAGFLGSHEYGQFFVVSVMFLLGCIFALLVCGFIAQLIVIQDELSRLNYVVEKVFYRLVDMSEKWFGGFGIGEHFPEFSIKISKYTEIKRHILMISFMILILIVGLGLVILRLERLSMILIGLSENRLSALSDSQLVKLCQNSGKFQSDYQSEHAKEATLSKIDFVSKKRDEDPSFVLQYTTDANIRNELSASGGGILFIFIGCIFLVFAEIAFGTLFR